MKNFIVANRGEGRGRNGRSEVKLAPGSFPLWDSNDTAPRDLPNRVAARA